MACATLKRSLDWESLNQRPSKRRRCTPYGTTSSSQTPVKVSENAQSPFMDTTFSKLTPGNILYNLNHIAILH